MLPKIEHPIHSLKLPSSKKIHNFRPFLVKEEKLLLMAKEGEDATDILKTIKQIVTNCCLDTSFDVDDITLTDLSYLFIKLRAISVDSKVKQTYKDTEDDKPYDFVIDLNNVNIVQDKAVNNNIRISTNQGMFMRYPTAKILDSLGDDTNPYALITRCIEKIYNGNEIHDTRNYKAQELTDWVDNLSVLVLEQINTFLDSAPRIEYVINYKNSLGHDRKIVLNTLDDFFMFH